MNQSGHSPKCNSQVSDSNFDEVNKCDNKNTVDFSAHSAWAKHKETFVP